MRAEEVSKGEERDKGGIGLGAVEPNYYLCWVSSLEHCLLYGELTIQCSLNPNSIPHGSTRTHPGGVF